MKKASVFLIVLSIMIFFTANTVYAATSFTDTIYGTNYSFTKTNISISYKADRVYCYYAFKTNLSFNRGDASHSKLFYSGEAYNGAVIYDIAPEVDVDAGTDYSVSVGAPFSISYAINKRLSLFDISLEQNSPYRVAWKGFYDSDAEKKMSKVISFKPIFVLKIPRDTVANLTKNKKCLDVGGIYLQYDYVAPWKISPSQMYQSYMIKLDYSNSKQSKNGIKLVRTKGNSM